MRELTKFCNAYFLHKSKSIYKKFESPNYTSVSKNGNFIYYKSTMSFVRYSGTKNQYEEITVLYNTINSKKSTVTVLEENIQDDVITVTELCSLYKLGSAK